MWLFASASHRTLTSQDHFIVLLLTLDTKTRKEKKMSKPGLFLAANFANIWHDPIPDVSSTVNGKIWCIIFGTRTFFDCNYSYYCTRKEIEPVESNYSRSTRSQTMISILLCVRDANIQSIPCHTQQPQTFRRNKRSSVQKVNCCAIIFWFDICQKRSLPEQ